jgi:hypothetical protein
MTAAIALLALLAQNTNGTRTQTIHKGETVVPGPGGNPGRTTGKTGTNSPFAKTNPATPAPTAPSVQPTPKACPSKILSWNVVRSGGMIGVGQISIKESGSDFGDRILCDLDTISKTKSGQLLLERINDLIRRMQQQGRGSDAFVEIDFRTPGPGEGPSTGPGNSGRSDWLRAQPASLSDVYVDPPVRPRTGNQIDWNAPATVTAPLPFWYVKLNSWVRGQGIGSYIRIDPAQFPLSSSSTPAHVALYHELVHALRHLEGTADRTPIFVGGDKTKADPTWLIREEEQVINGNFAVGENVYRGELGLPARQCVAPGCF